MKQHGSNSRGPRCGWLASTSLALTLLSGSVLAQSPTTSPTPTPVQPAPGVQPSTTLSPGVPVNPQLIIGRWKHTRVDAETRTSDTVVIEFLTDGRYQARNRHSLFPTPEKPSQGRYQIANVGKDGFDLRIERNLVDPESDPADAVEVQRITVVDQDTLQAADGSVVRRIKE